MMKSKTNGIVFLMICLVAGLCTTSAYAAVEHERDKAPWWDQEKIRFFWGQWDARFRQGTAPLSWDQIMGNIRAVGANVFVAQGDRPQEEHVAAASIAQKHGLRYLATKYTSGYRSIAKKLGSRRAVNRDGFTAEEEAARGMKIQTPHVPCPLDEGLVNEWLLKPVLGMAESGVIAGCHIDMEAYGATSYDRPNDNLCYCDHCFDNYADKEKLNATVARSDRVQWLQQRELLNDYLGHQRDRLADLYRRVAQRVRKVKPDFIFSVYENFAPDDLKAFWRIEGVLLGLNSESVPVLFTDPSHYGVNHTVPWWESSYSRIRKLGFKHILGSYAATVYGHHAERAISAEQWMYEAAMSHDGYWLWFEHRFGPTDYAVFRAAEHRIAQIENRIGDLLNQSRQDNTFVCLVEQSGNPDRSQFIRQRSYHLDEHHLVWVFNANDDHRVQVRVRVPRLPKDQRWTATAARSGLRYTHAGGSTWTSDDLARGLLLVIEKRSDAWLLVAPDDGRGADPGRSLRADLIRAHPNRPDTGSTQPGGSAPAGALALLYIKQEPLDLYRGGSGLDPNPVVGTSVHMIVVSDPGGQDRKLFPVRGKPFGPLGWDDLAGACWHPVLSPDRTRVAFASWVNGRGQVYVMNADGSSPRNISGNNHCDTRPVWSPDGKRIAFVSDRDGDWELYVMNADGRESRRLTQSLGVDKHPSWSPDGRFLAFVSDRNGDFDLYIVGSDGRGQRQVLSRPGNEYEPCWSPDGTRLACTTGMYGGGRRDVVVLDPQTGAADHPKGLLFAANNWTYYNIHGIRWSPDGTKIAGAFEVRWRSGIFVINLDPLESHEPVAVAPLKPKPGGTLRGYRLVGGWYSDGNASRRWLTRQFDSIKWLPDSQRIAFRSDMDPSGYNFLYTVAEDGTEFARIDDSMSPAGANNQLPAMTRTSSVKALPVSRSLDGDDYQALLPMLQKVESLPVEGWKFKDDGEGLGGARGYWNPDFPEDGMVAIRVDKSWDHQGYPGLKEGWYRLRYRCPELSEGKRAFLQFGAVDESAWLYIDGLPVAWYDPANPGITWEKPVLFDVTGSLIGGQEHTLVVRVKNATMAGGLWKPITLLVY